jgi:hypothetical protein
MRFDQKILVLIAMIISLSWLTAPVSASNEFLTGEMAAAKSELETALNFLKKANVDKGGFRDKAIAATKSAISSVNNNIMSLNKRRSDVFTGGDDDLNETFPAPEHSVSDVQNLVQAKKYLSSALKNIQNAAPDTVGYRTKAIAYVNDAISAVNKVIHYKNPKA